MTNGKNLTFQRLFDMKGVLSPILLGIKLTSKTASNEPAAEEDLETVLKAFKGLSNKAQEYIMQIETALHDMRYQRVKGENEKLIAAHHWTEARRHLAISKLSDEDVAELTAQINGAQKRVRIQNHNTRQNIDYQILETLVATASNGNQSDIATAQQALKTSKLPKKRIAPLVQKMVTYQSIGGTTMDLTQFKVTATMSVIICIDPRENTGTNNGAIHVPGATTGVVDGVKVSTSTDEDGAWKMVKKAGIPLSMHVDDHHDIPAGCGYLGKRQDDPAAVGAPESVSIQSVYDRVQDDPNGQTLTYFGRHEETMAIENDEDGVTYDQEAMRKAGIKAFVFDRWAMKPLATKLGIPAQPFVDQMSNIYHLTVKALGIDKVLVVGTPAA